jgi:hypothetical protein
MMQVDAVEKVDFALKPYIIIATRKYYNNNLVKKSMINLSVKPASPSLELRSQPGSEKLEG